MIEFNFDGAKVTRHPYRAKQVAHFGKIEGEAADYYRLELDKLADVKHENNHVVYEVEMRTGTMFFQWSDSVLYFGMMVVGEPRSVWIAEHGEDGEGRGIIGVANTRDGVLALLQPMIERDEYEPAPARGTDKWDNGSVDYLVLTQHVVK